MDENEEIYFPLLEDGFVPRFEGFDAAPPEEEEEEANDNNNNNTDLPTFISSEQDGTTVATTTTSTSSSRPFLPTNASFHDASRLSSSLNTQKLMDMAPDQLPNLLQSLTSFIDDKTSIIRDMSALLKPISGSDSHVFPILVYVDCVSATLCTYVYMSELSQRSKHIHPPKPLVEEHFVQAIMIAHEFFVKTLSNTNTNLNTNNTNNTTTVSPGKETKGRGSKKDKDTAHNSAKDSTYDAKTKRSFATAWEMLLPSFAHFFDMLRLFTYVCLPTGNIAYLLMETTIFALQVDQSQMTRFGINLTKTFPMLKALYQAAMLLLRIFYRHSEYREHCNQLFVSSIHQLSSAKSTWKPYAIDHTNSSNTSTTSNNTSKNNNGASNTSSTNAGRVSAVMFALITCIQSVNHGHTSITSTSDKAKSSSPSPFTSSTAATHRSSNNSSYKDISSAYYQAMKSLTSDLLQRCCDKDLSDDYFATTHYLVQELLTMSKSLFHPVSVMFLQLLTLTICIELTQRNDTNTANNNTDNNNNNTKRDLAMINQLLELLGAIAEGLTKLRIDWSGNTGYQSPLLRKPINNNNDNSSAISNNGYDNNIMNSNNVSTNIVEHCVNTLLRKWTHTKPVWYDTLTALESSSASIHSNSGNSKSNSNANSRKTTPKRSEMQTPTSYWFLKNAEKVTTVSTKSSGTTPVTTDHISSNSQGLSYLQEIDIMGELNMDINDIVFEAQSLSPFDDNTTTTNGGISNLQDIQEHLADACISLTWHVLESLPPPFQLRKMLQKVGEHDLRYVKLVRTFIETFGLETLSSNTNNSSANSNMNVMDERCTDNCIALFHSWIKHIQSSTTTTSSSTDINNGSDQQESIIGELQALLVSLIRQEPVHTISINTHYESSSYNTNNSTVTNNSYNNSTNLQLQLQLQRHQWKQSLPRFITNTSTPEILSISSNIQLSLLKPQARILVYKLIETFLQLLADSSPLIRSRALKMLSRISLIDPTMLSLKRVKEAIDKVVNDRAISVREESVKIISGYIINNNNNTNSLNSNNSSEEANYYLLRLLPLMADEGISVRKSVMMVLRDTLLTCPFHAHYRAICSALLGRLAHDKEEESIKELICSIFQSLWFLPPAPEHCATLAHLFDHGNTNYSNYNSGGNNNDEDSNKGHNNTVMVTKKINFITQFDTSTASSAASNAKIAALHVRFTSLQLIELLVFQEESRPWILSLLQSLLHGKAAGNELSSAMKVKRLSSFTHCEKIIAFQMELLLRCEEQQESVLEYLQVIDIPYDIFKVHILACIALFSTAHPPFITEVSGFLPYLRVSVMNKTNMDMCGHVMRIIQATSCLQKTRLQAHGDDILKDLANVALKQSTENVDIAIDCMATLVSQVTQDATLYFQLAKTCFDPLVGIAKRITNNNHDINNRCNNSSINHNIIVGQLDTAQLNMFRRCITVLGFLCEHARKCSYQLQLLLPSEYRRPDKDNKDTPNHDSNSSNNSRKYEAYEEQAARTYLPECVPLHPLTIFGSSFAAVLFVLDSFPREETLLVAAVKALCGIFSGYPKLMDFARRINILERLFEDNNSSNKKDDISSFSKNNVPLPVSVTATFLSSLKDMMVAEETRLEHQATFENMADAGVVTLSKRANVLGAGNSGNYSADSTMGGFILHQYLDVLKGFLQHRHVDIRTASLQLIGTLLRQGMINPAEVIEDLVMLQGDNSDISSTVTNHSVNNNSNNNLTNTRTMALQILLQEDERHPTFVEAKLVEGIEKMFDVTWQRHNNCINNTTDTNNVIMNNMEGPALQLTHLYPSNYHAENFLPLFSKIIATDRKKCLRFLASILDKCNTNTSITINNSTNSSSTNSSKNLQTMIKKGPQTIGQFHKFVYETHIKQLCRIEYFAGILAHLPYTTSEEPLQMISFISRNVPVDMTTFIKQLIPLLEQLGFTLSSSLADNTNHTNSTIHNNNSNNNINNSNYASMTANAWEYLVASIPDDVILLNTDRLSHNDSMNSNSFAVINSGLSADSPRTFFALWFAVYELILALRKYEVLLRLKSYLKQLYNLSDERCQLYRVGDPAGSYEKFNSANGTNNNALLFEQYGTQFFSIVPKQRSAQDPLKEKPAAYFNTSNNSNNNSTTNSSVVQKLVPFAIAVAEDFNRIVQSIFHEPNDTVSLLNTQHHHTTNNHNLMNNSSHNANNGISNVITSLSGTKRGRASTVNNASHKKASPDTKRKYTKKANPVVSGKKQHNGGGSSGSKKWQYDSSDEEGDFAETNEEEETLITDTVDHYNDANHTGSGRRGLRQRNNVVNYAAYAMIDEDDEFNY